jgi:hypothetical protein
MGKESGNITKVIFTCNRQGTTLVLAQLCTAKETGGAWEKNCHMDSAAILMVLFGSVISVTTALTFMEVRRMRKSGTKSSAS